MNPSIALRARVFVFISALVVPLLCIHPALGAEPGRIAAEALTQSLVDQSAAYGEGNHGAKPRTLQQVIDTAAKRQALLAELIVQEPGTVLRTAIPDRYRKRMPARVQALVEQHIELEGDLEVRIEDYRDGSYGHHYSLNSRGDSISLYFKSPPSRLQTGRRVRVSGVQVEDAMAVDSGENDLLILALGGEAENVVSSGTPAPVPNTFGEQSTLVILVNFQNYPIEPYSLDFARDVILGETSDFFLENSYGQTWLSGSVTGWHTIPIPSTECDGVGIRDYAEQAAIDAGFDLGSYSHLVYAFPQNACGFWGSATVGGTPSRAWLNGDLGLEMTGHELGHNLGLEHSHSLLCDDGTSVGSGTPIWGTNPWPNCSTVEYGDGVDIMGWSDSGHFNAYQKERLGWLGYGTSPAITTVESGGSYEIGPYAAQDGDAPKALKILKAVDQSGYRTWYYLEYRQAIGFDSILSVTPGGMDPSNVLNGVTVHVNWEGNGGNSGFLLDMFPETYDMYEEDPALEVGETFTDPDGNVTFITDWTDSGGAIVTVQLDAPVCATTEPLIELSPSQSQWVEAGTQVVYDLMLSNLDSISCPASTFDLSASVPADWTANFADGSLTISPGDSGATTLMVTSSTNAADGFYDVTVHAENASDPGFAQAAAVTYVVSNPAVNQAPIPGDDSAETSQESAVSIDVLGNDTDPDGDPLTVTSVSQGSNGSVVINSDDSLTYLPNDGFAGTDTFSYIVSDDEGASGAATVTVTVAASPNAPNRAPVALDDEVMIEEEAPVTINVMANDSDPDGDTLTLASATQGAKGTVTINLDGTLTYAPAKKFKDKDSFTYTISDGTIFATATVTITLATSNGGDPGGGKRGRKSKGNP